MYFNMYTLHTYIYDMLIFMVNVGKYTSSMDPIVTYTSHWAPNVGQKKPEVPEDGRPWREAKADATRLRVAKGADVYLGFV